MGQFRRYSHAALSFTRLLRSPAYSGPGPSQPLDWPQFALDQRQDFGAEPLERSAGAFQRHAAELKVAGIVAGIKAANVLNHPFRHMMHGFLDGPSLGGIFKAVQRVVVVTRAQIEEKV